MPELQVGNTAEWATGEYAAPFCVADGLASSSFWHPDGFDEWIATAELRDGATLEWSGPHGDEAIYVLDGELDAGGLRCTTGGSVVIESNATAMVRAVAPSRIVHVGSTTPDVPGTGPFGPARPDEHGTHVVGSSGLRGEGFDAESGAHHCSFAGGDCPTCRIVFFRVWGDGPTVAASHSHSQDELIHVVGGELRFGRTVVPAGSTIAIPADRRYGFRTPGPWAFLNYRRDVSFMTRDPKQPPVLEGAAPGRGSEAL